LKGYRKYYINKLLWFFVTFVVAFLLNFILPRLMPGDPVAAIVSRLAQGMSNTTGIQAIYQQYADLFGTNKPMFEQFILYVRNVAQGNFGFSFSQYPRTVADVISSSSAG
jgi:peptide/nickel transport system permease protein